MRTVARTRTVDCASCGEAKLLRQMRHPGATRGKTPSVCQVCRDARPAERWCDYHLSWHSSSRFTPRPAFHVGFANLCSEAMSIKLSESRGYGPISCLVCGLTKPSHRFRGGRQKAVACKECEDSRPADRWCPGCMDWLPKTAFTRTGSGKRYQAARCVPCRTAWSHGTTVAALLLRQGVTRPECGSCGATAKLGIDHDHRHCPGPNGCAECVQGWLCHPCNSAEGLLRTPGRARQLAIYMEKTRA